MTKQGRTAARHSATLAAGLAFAASAHAQSSVTLYGVLDASILYTNRTLDHKTGGNAGRTFGFADAGNSASRIGLRGVEDLGGGLRAMFALESGINVGTGGYNISNGNFFGRQAWVGLDSPYGTVKLGLQYSPFLIAADHLDPRGGALFGSSAVNYVDNVAGTGIFTPNAVSYTSPRIAGLQARALLSLGNAAGSFQAGRAYSASIDYELGGLSVAAALYDSNAGSTANTPIPTTVAFEGRIIGAGYRFGPVTAKASFANYKVAGGFNSNVYTAGFEVLVTPAVIVNGSVGYTSDRNHTANHSILAGLGAQYGLSKRTWLYAQAALVDNHGAMNTGVGISGALHAPRGRTMGADIGIRHAF